MTKAILFDLDGTLLDSVDLHARAWQDAFQEFGHDVNFEQVRYQIGKGGDEILPLFLSPEEVKTKGEALKEFRAQLFKDRYLSEVKPFPKVRELFEAVLARGQTAAIASSATGDQLKQFEEIAGIADLVHTATSSADAERSKPHPDIFEAALDRLGSDVSHDRIIVVGDTPHDAEAAAKAGLRTVGVLCGGFKEADLRQAGCIAIYAGPQELLERYDDTPLAPGWKEESSKTAHRTAGK